MELNWQTLIAIALLIAAVAYVVRTIIRSFQARHDCPDCEVSSITKKPKAPKHFKQQG